MEPQPQNKNDTPKSEGLSDDSVKELNVTLAALREVIDEKNKMPPLVPPVQADVSNKANDKTDYKTSDIVDLNLDEEQTSKLVKVLEERDEKIEARLEKKYFTDQEKRTYAVLLDSKFPELKDQHSLLYKKTAEIIGMRMKADPKYLENNPSAIYDSACVAFVEVGRINPQASNNPSEDKRLSAITGGYVLSGNQQKPNYQKEEITDAQKYFASKFNVSPDVYKSVKYERDPDGTWIIKSQ